MDWMPDVPPRPPGGCSCSSRSSENQTAILTPLTRRNRPHHQARGFDQAREVDRARHSKLMHRSPSAIELTFDCNNSVINLIVAILSQIVANHDKNICAARACGWMASSRRRATEPGQSWQGG